MVLNMEKVSLASVRKIIDRNISLNFFTFIIILIYKHLKIMSQFDSIQEYIRNTPQPPDKIGHSKISRSIACNPGLCGRLYLGVL